MEPNTDPIQPKTTNDFLRAGIAAARAGQREQARDMLMRVVEVDETNVAAWLWLSGVVDSLDDREVCLENVLALDAGNDAARRGLDALYKQKANQLLRQGIAAVRSGERESAHDLLGRAVECDPDNPSAWLWLSGVVDDLDERELCLENVLALDPQNAAAHKGLAQVRQEKAQRQQQQPAPESPWMARASAPVTPAAAMLQEDFARQRPEPEPEPEPKPASLPDALSDEYQCIYCAAPTQPETKTCPACGNDLWIKFRKREDRSRILWLLIGFQLFNTAQMALAPVVLLLTAWATLALERLASVSTSDPIALLNLYLGLRSSLTPQAAQIAFQAVPRAVFLLSFLPVIFSAVVLVGLYLRWKAIYYLLMADAFIGICTAFLAMFLGKNIIYGGIGLLIAVIRFLLIFQTEEDFQWERERLLLRVDQDLSSSTDFIVRGNTYAKSKMWGLAALHFRRAAAWSTQDLDSRVALTVAYIRLQKYRHAARALQEAKGINPSSPRVAELEELLNEVSASDQPEPTP